ncbi:Uncharacterised protein [uncultured archaeon]|nr:Uncharacterised protein [uncultured archaeon]
MNVNVPAGVKVHPFWKLMAMVAELTLLKVQMPEDAVSTPTLSNIIEPTVAADVPPVTVAPMAEPISSAYPLGDPVPVNEHVEPLRLRTEPATPTAPNVHCAVVASW